MWIFLNDSFVSIVADEEDPDRLKVRARTAGDLERLFPEPPAGCRVKETPANDYRFRISLPRDMVASVIAGRIGSIDYPNFKGSIPNDPGGNERHDAYLQVWTVMKRHQHRKDRPGTTGHWAGRGLFGDVVDAAPMPKRGRPARKLPPG